LKTFYAVDRITFISVDIKSHAYFVHSFPLDIVNAVIINVEYPNFVGGV